MDLKEEDLEESAKKALSGDLKGASVVLVGTLVTLASGHPLLGAVSGTAFAKVVDLFFEDENTRRMMEAGEQYDAAREKELTHHMFAMVKTLTARQDAGFRELGEQANEQFLQTLHFMKRNLATKDGLEKVYELVGQILDQIGELGANRGTGQHKLKAYISEFGRATVSAARARGIPQGRAFDLRVREFAGLGEIPDAWPEWSAENYSDSPRAMTASELVERLKDWKVMRLLFPLSSADGLEGHFAHEM